MNIATLASGSKGNCTLVTTEKTNIIIDMGISYKELNYRLDKIGFFGNIDAVLVTHSHTDHIKGLAMFAHKQNARVYASKWEWQELSGKTDIDDSQKVSFDSVFRIGDIDVMPFSTPHDSRFSCGYTLDCEGKKFSLATDLGHVTEKVYNRIIGSHTVIIESNYDKQMLLGGVYPEYLKARILSKVGHLSNDDCKECCLKLAQSGTKNIILGHLSENNNLPELAYKSCYDYLSKNGVKIGEDVNLEVALQGTPSRFFSVK